VEIGISKRLVEAGLRLGLTKTQARATVLLCSGLTYAECGKELHIAPRTVEVHLYNARKILRARNSLHLVTKLLWEYFTYGTA
jgi:DNA-binding CsgD family transcriptional regulator